MGCCHSQSLLQECHEGTKRDEGPSVDSWDTSSKLSIHSL